MTEEERLAAQAQEWKEKVEQLKPGNESQPKKYRKYWGFRERQATIVRESILIYFFPGQFKSYDWFGKALWKAFNKLGILKLMTPAAFTKYTP